jgi:hypothetical protein
MSSKKHFFTHLTIDKLLIYLVKNKNWWFFKQIMVLIFRLGFIYHRKIKEEN